MTPKIAKLLSRHDYLETVIRSHADQIRDKVPRADRLRICFPMVARSFHAVAQALKEEEWPLPEITEVPWDDFRRAAREVFPNASRTKWGLRGMFDTPLDLGISPPVQD